MDTIEVMQSRGALPAEQINYVDEVVEVARVKAEGLNAISKVQEIARENVSQGRALARSMRDYYNAVEEALDAATPDINDFPHEVASRIRRTVQLSSLVHGLLLEHLIPDGLTSGNYYLRGLDRRFVRQRRKLEWLMTEIDKAWSGCILKDFSSSLRAIRRGALPPPSAAFEQSAKKVLEEASDDENSWKKRAASSLAGTKD